MSFLRKNLQKRQEKLLDLLLARTRQLADFPESGSRYKTEKSLTRQNPYLVEGNSEIIYSWEGDGLYVESIVDTRQDPEQYRI